jgi:putative inorganic carbon (HCO3(-)) transporter
MQRSSSLEWWRPDITADAALPARTVSEAGARGSSMPFWALMAFTAILLISPQSYFPAFETLRLAFLAAGLAGATYLWDRLVYRLPLSIRSREIGLAAALGVWALVTTPFSYAPGESLAFFFGLYAKSLVIFVLLANVVSSVQRLRSIAWELSLIAIPLALTAVYNFSSGVFHDPTVRERIAGYQGAIVGNPNDLALMINLILPLSVALLLIHRRPAARLLLAAGIGLSAVAIILTFSRGGFVTLATLFLLYLWKFRRRPERRWMWALFAFLLACVPLAGPEYLDRLATIANMEKDETGSAQQRWGDMAAAAEFTLGHPIAGAGIGQNLRAVREVRGADGYPVHNVYLEYAAELGIPGLALFLMLLVGGIKSAALVQRKAQQTPGRRELFYLAEGIQTSLIAFAVSCLFYPVAYHVHFYYMAGLAAAATAMCQAKANRGN